MVTIYNIENQVDCVGYNGSKDRLSMGLEIFDCVCLVSENLKFWPS